MNQHSPTPHDPMPQAMVDAFRREWRTYANKRQEASRFRQEAIALATKDGRIDVDMHIEIEMTNGFEAARLESNRMRLDLCASARRLLMYLPDAFSVIAELNSLMPFTSQDLDADIERLAGRAS